VVSWFRRGLQGWSASLGLVGASGPRYGVRRLDAAFAARRAAPRHRPGARLPKCKAEAELPHSKGRAKTTRGLEMPPRFIGALPFTAVATCWCGYPLLTAWFPSWFRRGLRGGLLIWGWWVPARRAMECGGLCRRFRSATLCSAPSPGSRAPEEQGGSRASALQGPCENDARCRNAAPIHRGATFSAPYGAGHASRPRRTAPALPKPKAHGRKSLASLRVGWVRKDR